jgi:hypothetical protein
LANPNNEQRRVLKIDKQAILDFAQICKKHGVQHFELLYSVGIKPILRTSLRTKGELVKSGKLLT